MNYILAELTDQVLSARANYRPILIKGGGSKSFYGNPFEVGSDSPVHLDMGALKGIVNYQPTELVITALSGTPLADIRKALDERNQMLAFDPPDFGTSGTIGGAVASGLSGPGRHSAGPLKDFVLGATLLDAQGRVLRFGGEVMKNVAGYDVSRLLAGSLGIFGAIAQVSLKVVPKPIEIVTIEHTCSEQEALSLFHSWRAQPLPVRSTVWMPPDDNQSDGVMRVCLAGASAAVRSAVANIRGDRMDEGKAQVFWDGLRDHTLPFFAAGPIWRVAVAPGTPALGLGPTIVEWGGGQRWMNADLDPEMVRSVAKKAGGHATLFKPDASQLIPEHGVFQPLEPGVLTIVQRLKHEFDPKGLFNPGRLVMGV